MAKKCCFASPSELDKRILIEGLSLVPNDTGGQVKTWDTVATVWARIKTKLKREINFAQRIEPRKVFEITIRYRAGLSESMRVVFENRIFQIKAMMNVDEQKEWILMECEEDSKT